MPSHKTLTLTGFKIVTSGQIAGPVLVNSADQMATDISLASKLLKC